MSSLASFSSLPIEGKRLLVRIDLNVPFVSENQIASDSRIQLLVPSLKAFLNKGCSLCLISHLESPYTEHLQACSEHLARLLGEEIEFVQHNNDLTEQIRTASSSKARIILLDNLRLHSGEKAADITFAKQLSSLGDIFINEAFSCSHREHASITLLPQYFRGKCGVGPLFLQEFNMISQMLEQPIHPVCLILGGGKVSTKLPLLRRCASWANEIILIGNVANAFLQHIYHNDSEYGEEIEYLLREHPKLLLPVDGFIEENKEVRLRSTAFLRARECFLDIGPYSLALIRDRVAQQGTVLWNGPAGYFEDPRFAQGTSSLLKILTDIEARTYIAGGDTLKEAETAHCTKKIDHIFSGGGASLSFIAHNMLPGIAAIMQNCI